VTGVVSGVVYALKCREADTEEQCDPEGHDGQRRKVTRQVSDTDAGMNRCFRCNVPKESASHGLALPRAKRQTMSVRGVRCGIDG
jgi:hypothetical protein